MRFFRTAAAFLVTCCTFRISPPTSKTVRSLPLRTAKPFWRVRELASSVHGQSGGLLCRDAPRLHGGRAQQVHETQPLSDASHLAWCVPQFSGCTHCSFYSAQLWTLPEMAAVRW